MAQLPPPIQIPITQIPLQMSPLQATIAVQITAVVMTMNRLEGKNTIKKR